MARIAPGPALACPERIYDTELLARVQNLACSLVHGTQDFRCLVYRYEIIQTPRLVPWPGREGAKIIFHGHCESAEPLAVRLAHSYVYENVY